MSVERSSWISAVVITVIGAASALGIIQALVVFGGQDWLIPGRTRTTVTLPQLEDKRFGLAEYVDRMLLLDRAGKVYVDGMPFDDAGLRSYLTKLRDNGGVQLTLHADSKGPQARREAIEKICAEVTGMKPEVIYATDLVVPAAAQIEVATDIPTEPEVAAAREKVAPEEVKREEVAREEVKTQPYDLESDLALP